MEGNVAASGPTHHGPDPASPTVTATAATAGRSWAQRPRFAETHLESAAFGARRAHILERTLPGGAKYEEQYYPDMKGDDGYIEHRACVTSAIFCAVSAGEGAVATLFVDAYEQDPSLRTSVEHALAARWFDASDKPLPLKVAAALRAVEARPRQLASWHDIETLLRLRNFLTHFAGGTAWSHPAQPVAPRDEPTSALANLEGILRDAGFALNPLEAGHVFPFTYLGYGCAAWAVRVSRTFVDEIYGRLETPSPFAATEEDARRHGRPSPFSELPLPPAAHPASDPAAHLAPDPTAHLAPDPTLEPPRR